LLLCAPLPELDAVLLTQVALSRVETVLDLAKLNVRLRLGQSHGVSHLLPVEIFSSLHFSIKL
jgi:hypothetical protein